MANEIYLLGCGGHARSVADVLVFNNPNIKITFVDANAAENEKIMGFPCIRELPEPGLAMFPAVGSNEIRKKLFQKDMPDIIAQDAYVAQTATIRKGTFVAHHAHIGPCSCIGNGCIINTAAVIDHECHIGNFCHISVNAAICGRCKLGDNVFLGAGAVVKDGISICDNVVIGAGAAVVCNIIEAGTYVGVPTRKIK